MKNDYVRRIDQLKGAPGRRAAQLPVSSGNGLPYSATQTPAPLTIPVSKMDGKLDPGWLADYTLSSGNGESSNGQTYVAPWVRLLQPLAAGADKITVVANGLTVGDNVAISYGGRRVEQAQVIGGPATVGEFYEYTLTRPNEQQDYPAGAQVFNLGQGDDGGYVTIISGDQAGHLQAPHINLWAYEDGTAVRKVRLGLLSGLSAEEKALFPDVDDWNRYSLYADDVFLKGQINATSGNITGDLDVSGTLGVWSGLGRAGVVMGASEGGHGIVLQNKEGRPVFAAISPYEDETGTLNEVALYIEHEGERGLYYHKNSSTGEYQLDISVDTLVDGTLRATNILAGTGTYPNAFTGMRFGAEGLQSYGLDFLPQIELDVQDGRLYFGGREGWLDADGIVIDTRQLAQGTDALDHTIRWIRQTNMIEGGWRVGASIGSEADALFATSRTYYGDLGIPNADPNQFYQAQLWLQGGPNDTTYLSAQNVEIRGDTSSALVVGRLNPVRASLDGAGRLSAPKLTIGGSVLHTTDDGASVIIGSNTATGARLVSESDTMAAFRGQRSDGQYIALTPAANAEGWLSASGTLVLAPAAGQTGQKYVLPSQDQTIALGSQARKWSDVYAQNGHFGALGSQTALAGQFYLTKRKMTLKVDLGPEDTTAFVREDGLLEGEFYRFENTDGNWEAIRINTVGIPTGDGYYEHEVERQQGADVDNGLGLARQWYAGDVGVSLGGNAQDGYIRLFGADDQNPNTGPAIVVMQRDNDDNPNSVSERAVFGNLNGWYGYAENKYGVAFGHPLGRWVSLDENEGLRIMEGDQQQAVYREYVQIGRPTGNNVLITDSSLALQVGNTPYIDMDNAGNMDLTGTLAVASGGAITWAGGKGRADDTKIQYIEDADNYWIAEPSSTHVNAIKTNTADRWGLYVTSVNFTAIRAESTTNAAIEGYGFHGIVGYTVGGAPGAGVIGNAGSAADSMGVYGIAAAADTVGIVAQATAPATTALQIFGGIVNGGNERYTALADATADTDALNRQTGDGRYMLAANEANYLLAAGTRTGASSQAQTFTNGIIGPSWKPASNSTTALQLQKADGTNVLDVDTTNGRVGVGTNAPTRLLDVSGDSRLGGHIYTASGSTLYTVDDVWSHGIYIKNSSGNKIAYFNPQYRSFEVGDAATGMQAALTAKPVANFPSLIVQAYSGQTTDVVQFQDLAGNNVYRLGYDNQHIFLGQMTVGGRANSAPSYDRLQGASQRYGVTFANCTATSSDALFNGSHTGAAMMCNAATSGQVEIDFNPFIGYTANTNTGYAYPQGYLLITFYSAAAAASDVTVEGYRPSGGADGWATLATVTSNTAASRLITIPASFAYLKKLRVTVSHASQAVWVAGLSYFPTSPESGVEAQNIQMYVPSTLAIANKGLYLYDTTWTARTKLDYKVADGGSAIAYLWDTANALSTAGAKLASWKNNGTEHTFIDRYGGLTVNESGADSDTRFEGDTDANLFFLDASADRIGVGTNTPGYKLDVAGGINVSTGNVYRVAGTQVVAAQGAAVTDATGGATVDAEARTAINTLLARLRSHGLIAT